MNRRNKLAVVCGIAVGAALLWTSEVQAQSATAPSARVEVHVADGSAATVGLTHEDGPTSCAAPCVLPAAPGRHTFFVSAPYSFQSAVEVPGGASRIDFIPFSGLRLGGGITLTTLGAAGVGTGLMFTILGAGGGAYSTAALLIGIPTMLLGVGLMIPGIVLLARTPARAVLTPIVVTNASGAGAMPVSAIGLRF